ncbi:hypothetical protein STXM2123_502 [Streptomyces sp. F-3]|nr:hypothetical protein STXM2123_502 [Streptomyces sp. F-3]
MMPDGRVGRAGGTDGTGSGAARAQKGYFDRHSALPAQGLSSTDDTACHGHPSRIPVLTSAFPRNRREDHPFPKRRNIRATGHLYE